MIGRLRFVHEPETLRFFTGKLEPTSDWPEKLAAAYKVDFEDCEEFEEDPEMEGEIA